LDLGLGSHRGADTSDLDPVAFAFRDAAEDRHDQIVGLVVGIDRAADLRHPQRHAVVSEQRERVAELVAVERPRAPLPRPMPQQSQRADGWTAELCSLVQVL
jgi:hypothetical protein